MQSSMLQEAKQSEQPSTDCRKLCIQRQTSRDNYPLSQNISSIYSLDM